MFQCLGRYPTSVRVFPDPIPFLAGLKPSWEYVVRNDLQDMEDGKNGFLYFIIHQDDEDLLFFPRSVSRAFAIAIVDYVDVHEWLELFVVHPGSIAAQIKDRKCKTRGGSSRPPVKRKLTPMSSTSRATCAKTSSSKDDASFLIVSNDDEGLLDVLKLKDATACHLKISDITPPA
ncbi:hypothetical protein Tco_0305210 [Tanacetum coccineum]